MLVERDNRVGVAAVGETFGDRFDSQTLGLASPDGEPVEVTSLVVWTVEELAVNNVVIARELFRRDARWSTVRLSARVRTIVRTGGRSYECPKLTSAQLRVG